MMRLAELSGHDLGAHEHCIGVDDSILYALAVGADASDLDLIYERRLRVLPTMACAIGLWAVEKAGELGAYDRTQSLHVGQTLHVKQPIEPGNVAMRAAVGGVYDKGRMTILEINVTADQFDAGYTILLPGVGDWGGPPAPPTDRWPVLVPQWTRTARIEPTAAALYRLTGDKHPVHIDAAAAEAMGLDRPILHGLATLAIVARVCARAIGVHPATLVELDARLSAPVYPGSSLLIAGSVTRLEPGSPIQVEASIADSVALSGIVGFQSGRPPSF